MKFVENYLQNRHQRVVLNGIESDWKKLHAGVPQELPMLLHKCAFADDSSLFTCVEGVELTQQKLVNDLQAVSAWAYQWKMLFNPDLTKQAI